MHCTKQSPRWDDAAEQAGSGALFQQAARRKFSIAAIGVILLRIGVFVLAVLIGFAAVSLMAADGACRVLPPGQLPQDARLGPLKDVNGYFPFVPPANRGAWERRASELRRQTLVAAGLWPMPIRSTTSPVIHGRVEREDYTVEKVILETYPGFFLTGNLYRPKGRPGKMPAVLSPHGHWPGGRFYDEGPEQIRKEIVAGAERFERGGRFPFQSRCVQLARMGCVVFHYDMVGYGDSKQLGHRDGDRPEMDNAAWWGFFSPQAELRLQTIFGLQTYDSLCALDFLCSLPDVDASRVGVTGASGGATQTLMLSVIDSRPAALFPAVMVSTAMQGGCPCENASYLRVNTGNVELAALFAPKPLGMTAADDWTKEIATRGLPELKRLYRLFDAEENVMAKPLLQFPHNYNYVSRAVMYSWFNRHLKLGLKEPIVEEDYRPLTASEMTVWDERHPAPPGGPDFERVLLQRMNENSRRQIASLLPHNEFSLAEYRRILGGAVETMIGRRLPPADALETKEVRTEDIGSCHLTLFLLRYPKWNEELPAVRIEPKRWNRRTVVWIDRAGKQSLFVAPKTLCPAVQTLVDNGFAVVAADLFEQGEFTSDGREPAKARMVHCDFAKPTDAWAKYAAYTFGYNHPLFSHRVHDVLSLVAYAGGDGHAVDMIGLHGAGHWVAAARAIAGNAISRAAIDTAGFRFANLTAIDDPDFLPGGVKYNDLPGMLSLSAPLPLWLAGEGGDESLVSAVYQVAGHSENLTTYHAGFKDAESAAVQWLLAGRP